VPPPQDTVQLPNAPACHAVTHACVLHAREDAGGASVHCAFETTAPGFGEVDPCTQLTVAVCVPPPQSVVHAEKALCW
jgi:hypothetical protein